MGLLKSPGIPWNLDVSLLVLVYLAIGFYYKKQIKNFLTENNKMYDISAVCAVAVLAVFCYMNYQNDTPYYYFDMKPVYYRELALAIIIPSLFALVLVRIIFWFSKIRITESFMTIFSYLGRMTMPIMFLHIPLNYWKDVLDYGIIIYMLIGVGGPVIFTLLFNRFEIMRKLFGLPRLNA